MNIFDLLELTESAADDAIRLRLEEKRRFFGNLAKTAPTKTLGEIYAKRIAELDAFAASRNLGGAAAAETSFAGGKASAAGSGALQDQFRLRLTDQPGAAPIDLSTGMNIVGRDPRALGTPIVLKDSFVSANHAVLEVLAGPPASVQLYDIGDVTGRPSSNGVFVNDATARLEGRVALRPGDRVRFGNTQLVLEQIAVAPLPSAAPAEDEHDHTFIVKRPFK